MKLQRKGAYPDNLIQDIMNYAEEMGRPLQMDERPEDLEGSLLYVLHTFLTHKERNLIISRYERNRTLEDTANEHGVTRERTRQIISKAIMKLSMKSTFDYISLGVARMVSRDTPEQIAQHRRGTPLECLGLSVRAYNCLGRIGVRTAGDIQEMDMREIHKLRGVGVKTATEIMCLKEQLR